MQLPVFSIVKIKVEAARPEWEEDGASDVEALFASQEDAKPPTILAAGTGYKPKSEGDSFSSDRLSFFHTKA